MQATVGQRWDAARRAKWTAAVEGVLEEFLALCRIPHQSGHEEAISAYLLERVRSFGLEGRRDENLNVIVDVPATEGLEGRPVVALQAHMDMVVAVDPGRFDPVRDAVHPVIEGDILHTDGRSSLGADNGIGVAAILYALRARRLPHGPLRVIFTSCEEVGLRGARLLQPEVLRDVRYLINLDGFHADRAVVGCMSGKRETFFHPMSTMQAMPDCVGVEVEINGLRGGHSGEDISAGRCNAIRLMAELLTCVRDSGHRVEIAHIEGGTGANVIPRSCMVRLAVPQGELRELMQRCVEEVCWVTAAYKTAEHAPGFRWEEVDAPRRVWTGQLTDDVLASVLGENNGVYAMSRQFHNVVGASSNLGRIFSDEQKVEINSMTRCESPELERKILHQHARMAETHGFSMGIVGYNAWHQEAKNFLTRAVEETYEGMFHRPIQVTIAPVGLEPAYFHEKAPWLTMITLGADIEDAHSTAERVHIGSLEIMYQLIAGALAKIARQADTKGTKGV